MIKTSLKSLPKSMNFITWQICFICLIWWQMLQAVSNIAPRGVYVCGNATSTSGLTVRKHWNLCYLVSNNLCCLMETWYSLIRRHKKTVDKIKIGLKGKQTRKFLNFIRTAMAADNRCGKFYRGLAKVTPLFQPFFAWTKICVCPLSNDENKPISAQEIFQLLYFSFSRWLCPKKAHLEIIP